MKNSTLENRLSVAAAVAVCAVLCLVIFDSLTSNSNASMFRSESASASNEDGVIAQVEDILSLSARHVFDEEYWIANMHSIRSSKF